MEKDTLSERFDAMRFDLERSIRYWSSRSIVWAGIVQAAAITTAVSGSAAVATVLSCKTASIVFAAVAAICGILSASFDAPSRARFCTERISLYTELLARCPMEGCDEKETPELLEQIRADRLRLEASETVILECLDVECHNKTCRALGRLHDIRRTTWLQRTLGRLIPLPYHEPPSKKQNDTSHSASA